MAGSKLLLLTLPFCFTAALLLLVPQERTGNEPISNSTMDPGSGVQQAYHEQIKRLRGYYESLAAMLRASAPDLVPLLDSPEPLEHGYGTLPRILTDQHALEPARSRSAGYSWPWTRRLLTEHESKIVRAERLLEGARAQDPATRRRIYETLAREYGELRMAQANIDAHIGYNQFWQTAVASDRAAYDRQTLLHDSVLERQAIRDALGAFDRAATSPFSSIDQKLRRREEALAQAIEGAVEPLAMPWFVRVERPAAHRVTRFSFPSIRILKTAPMWAR
jgi:hypothetical protein